MSNMWRVLAMTDRSRQDKTILWAIRIACLAVGALVGWLVAR